jgi:hypothetical protein
MSEPTEEELMQRIKDLLTEMFDIIGHRPTIIIKVKENNETTVIDSVGKKYNYHEN